MGMDVAGEMSEDKAFVKLNGHKSHQRVDSAVRVILKIHFRID